MTTLSGEFLKGLYKENPVFRLALGLCPTLAVRPPLTTPSGWEQQRRLFAIFQYHRVAVDAPLQ